MGRELLEVVLLDPKPVRGLEHCGRSGGEIEQGLIRRSVVEGHLYRCKWLMTTRVGMETGDIGEPEGDASPSRTYVPDVGISDRCEGARCTARTIPILDYSFVVLISAFQVHTWYLYCLHVLYR